MHVVVVAALIVLVVLYKKGYLPIGQPASKTESLGNDFIGALIADAEKARRDAVVADIRKLVSERMTGPLDRSEEQPAPASGAKT